MKCTREEIKRRIEFIELNKKYLTPTLYKKSLMKIDSQYVIQKRKIDESLLHLNKKDGPQSYIIEVEGSSERDYA